MVNTKIKNMVIAAILTAFTIVIPLVFTFFPLKISIFEVYTATLSVHAPTIIAMFVSPAVAVFVAMCSAIGFFVTSNPLVAFRALSHIFFAFAGAYMIKKHKNVYLVCGVTALIHAVAEVLVIYTYSFFGAIPSKELAMHVFLWITFFGTIIHHMIDWLIAGVVMKALRKAKLM